MDDWNPRKTYREGERFVFAGAKYRTNMPVPAGIRPDNTSGVWTREATIFPGYAAFLDKVTSTQKSGGYRTRDMTTIARAAG